MGLFTIIRIFVLAISFNIFLPTGDIYSDIGLMVQTIKFQNSDSQEMLGCRACYGKEEAEIERRKLTNCTTCITKNLVNRCGRLPSSINKLLEIESVTEENSTIAFSSIIKNYGSEDQAAFNVEGRVVDSEGNELWMQTYGEGYDDKGYSIEMVDDGFVIAGYTYSFNSNSYDMLNFI